jgi:hypothetical protein
VAVYYLYCLARTAALAAFDDPAAGEERALSLIPFKDVVAVVSEVRLDDFVGPSADARMKDLAWVGPRACRHEAVVEWVMRTSPVVPARFAALFSSRESLDAWLERHHDAISRALEQFADHEEWAVKGTLDKRTAEARLYAAALVRRGGELSSSPGRRYFEERRMRAGIAEDLDMWLKEVGVEIAKTLLECATDLRERPVVTGAAPSEEPPRILNWAFLVAQSRASEFGARIQQINERYAEHGLVLDISGPWPPYSFSPSLEPESAQ